MKVKRTMKKIIAFVLIASTALLYPVQISAEAINEAVSEAANQDFTVSGYEDDYVEGQIIAEVESKRTSNEKTFLLDDGNYMAVQYPEPVHYMNEEGKWVEYNNTMVAKMVTNYDENSEDTSTETIGEETSQSTVKILEDESLNLNSVEDDTSYNQINTDSTENFTEENTLNNAVSNGLTASIEYDNIQSDVDIVFSNKAKEKNMIKVTVDNYKISWGYHEVNNVSVKFKDYNTAFEGNDAYLVLTDLTQTALYENAFKDTDIECIAMPNGVKENLILKSANADNEYVIEYKIDSLTAVQSDDQKINLVDSAGNIIYSITAPMMKDSDGDISSRVKIEIVSQKNKRLIIKLTADKEWLLDSERAFPVTVDPGFITKQEGEHIQTGMVTSGSPDTAWSASQVWMPVGYEFSPFNKSRIMVKPQSLPELSPGDVIVHAEISMLRDAFLGSMPVYAHKATSGWNSYSVTWNNQPTYDNTVLDYMNITGTYTGEPVVDSWDITSTMREWYNDSSTCNGIVFTSPAENDTYVHRALYLSGFAPTGTRPVFSIIYRNNAGLESYWSYHQQNFSGGVTAYVNDYSGNLVITAPISGLPGRVTPYNLTMTYNTYNSFNHFHSGDKGHVCGAGWMNSNDQRIDPIDNIMYMDSSVKEALKEQGYEYVYTDSDGTMHYFTKKDDTTDQFEDEDGLSLTLTKKSSGTYTLEAKTGEKLTFDTRGYVTSIIDKYGNTSTLNYHGTYHALDAVTDAAGRKMNYTYDGTIGQVTVLRSVTNAAGEKTSVTYNENGMDMIRLTYADGKSVSFDYDKITLDGKEYYVPKKITDIDGSYVTYEYEQNANVNAVFKFRVKKITEYAADGTKGNAISIEYGTDGTTTFTYEKTSGNVSSKYSFDNFGRTISVINSDGTAMSQSYQEVGDDGNKSTQNNRISKVASGAGFIDNLLSNHSFEGSTGWRSVGHHDQSVNENITSSDAYLGNKVHQITNNGEQYINTSIVKYSQDITVTPGEYYTLSAYVKTDNVVTNKDFGATVIVYNGLNELEPVSVQKYVDGTSDWQRISVTVQIPEGMTTVTPSCVLKKATGTAYFDCVQFEKGKSANNYNMVEDGSFSKTSSWETEGLGTGEGQIDGKLKIEGVYNVNKKCYQRVYIGNKLNAVNISGKSTTSSVPIKEDSEREFCIYLEVKYDDGTTSKLTQSFSHETTGEQYLNKTVMMPKENIDKVISYIDLYISYSNNANTAYFDDVMMTFDKTGASYTYDEDGNPISANDNAERNQSYEFNDAGEITKLTDETNKTYSYFYSDSNSHQITGARVNSLGNGYTFSYDSYGNVTGTKLGVMNTDGVIDTSKPYIEGSTEYTTSGTYVKKITDQSGNTVTYDTDENRGLTEKVSYPNGYGIEYDYNASHQTTKVTDSLNRKTIDYTYNSDNQLTKISQGGLDYHLVYDNFGNVTEISVGNNVLTENTYAANNGNLIKAEYGNGTVIEYNYDQYDRVVSQEINDQLQYETVYNAKGEVSRIDDYAAGTKTEYYYDLIGRPVQAEMVIDNADGDLYAGVTQQYDIKNRVTGMTTEITVPTSSDKIREAKFEYSYNSTTDLPEYVSFNDRRSLSYEYDELGRVTQRKYNTSGASARYTYQAGKNSGTTTNLISQIQNDWGETLSYTYDSMGNILTLSIDGNLAEKYTYDLDGTLIEVYQKWRDTVYTYDYDDRGNILSTKEYYCTNGENKYLRTMSGYTYDYNWKDLLTSYDGSVITYDEIGNPLTYRDSMTMSWEGRRLSSINNGAINYEYDSSGIRSKKTVDGNTTVFYNIGGVKAGEYRDDGIDILYLYDDKGKIYGISVNEQIYYFMENIQGDVIGLYDYYGRVCARYTYDPWGNIIDVQELDTVTFGEDNKKIGEVNPFRYRGYYYDTETGFYYLNSRYYDPQVKRFINSDAYASTGQGFNGTNMFCYCLNNPVNNADYMGNKAITIRGYSVDSQKWAAATIKYGTIGAMNELMSNPEDFAPEKSMLSKITDTLYYPLASVRIEGGIGIGLKISGTIDGINFSIGYKYDFFHFIISPEEIWLGTYEEKGYGFDIYGVGLGDYYITKQEYGSNKPKIEYSPVTNPGFSADKGIGIGGGAYIFGGANLSVTWDIEYIVENIKETWS